MNKNSSVHFMSYLSPRKMGQMSAFGLIVLAQAGYAAKVTAAETVTVQPWTKQTFQGFGGAAAFNGFIANDASTSTVKSSLYDAMFSELKLKFLRFDLDPSFRPTESSGYNLNAAVVNTGQKDAIDAARSRTGNNIKLLYSVWSPPSWMKGSGVTTGKTDKNWLNSHHQDAFGNYLAEFTTRFNSAYGFPVDYLSMQNEPDVDVPYDSCLYSADYYAETLMKVRARMNAYGSTTKLLAPEKSNADNAYYKRVMDRAESSFDIGAAHSYGSDIGWIESAYRNKKPIFQTEWSILTDNDGGANYAAQLARQFCLDTNNGDTAAWFWWKLAGTDRESQGESLLVHNGYWSPYVKYSSFTRTKKFYAFKGLTHTVAQGAVNRWTDVTTSNLAAAGFRNPNGKYVLVVANSSSTNYSGVTLRINELANTGSRSFTSRRTDSQNNEATAYVTYSNGVLSNVSIPANTVLCYAEN